MNNEAKPVLVSDWLLMDSWLATDGLLLIVGLEPETTFEVNCRAEVSVFERNKIHFSTRELPRYLRTLEGVLSRVKCNV
ncbi:hypothetical protein HF909_04780 [Ralstonia pseudosolanacearum]|uniref:Uncharacterized protein n=1 Tax=Ralstonia solanacearum TaxID=305 RepID=A0AA92JZM5_RALSL|nr:hypothetical protein [Ralstonia pseudosolanacearum]QOK95811.1 hypothetical protein HF909_04780 [Ralstonia pseudosolanacearum]